MLLSDSLQAEIKKFGTLNNLKFESVSINTKNKSRVKIIASYSSIEHGLDRFQKAYLDKAYRYNLPVNALYERLTNEQDEFRVIGWEESNRKYPIIISTQSGQKYKLHPKQFIELYHSCLKEPLD
ncbi:hypothetical protein [Vibrio owensii]|uniref:hypothetical protein n=1 Tax=Vibrio harveyi group TaxID=717610 RepID=UPI003CC6C96F